MRVHYTPASSSSSGYRQYAQASRGVTYPEQSDRQKFRYKHMNMNHTSRTGHVTCCKVPGIFRDFAAQVKLSSDKVIYG